MHSKKRRRNFLLPVKINACDEPRDLRAAYVHHASLYGPGREAELNTLIYRLARELRCARQRNCLRLRVDERGDAAQLSGGQGATCNLRITHGPVRARN